jgi:hypothetical protein
MNPSIKIPIPSFLIALLALACIIGLLPKAYAVSPAPDGGYPGGNTAEGQTALLSLTTGGFNTAVGFFSLRSDTTASFNTAIGAGTLLANTGDQNTANGAGALLSNTTGNFNTADGSFALSSNTTGHYNTAIGRNALPNNTTGVANTAIGNSAGANVTTAFNVICIGAGLLGDNVGNSCFIANIRGVQTQNGDAIPVLIDSALRGDPKRRSNRWIKPAKRSWRLSQ